MLAAMPNPNNQTEHKSIIVSSHIHPVRVSSKAGMGNLLQSLDLLPYGINRGGINRVRLPIVFFIRFFSFA
jgi:hypothetical protein